MYVMLSWFVPPTAPDAVAIRAGVFEALAPFRTARLHHTAVVSAVRTVPNVDALAAALDALGQANPGQFVYLLMPLDDGTLFSSNGAFDRELVAGITRIPVDAFPPPPPPPPIA